MASTWSRLRSRCAHRSLGAIAVAAALPIAGCGSARNVPQARGAPPQSAQPLSLNASCAQWELASANERRSFTDRLYGAGSSSAVHARGDLPPDELRLLIALHCGGASAAGTPLGVIVVNAIVGTLGAGDGRAG